MPRRLLIAAGVITGLLVAACSDDDGAVPTTATATTATTATTTSTASTSTSTSTSTTAGSTSTSSTTSTSTSTSAAPTTAATTTVDPAADVTAYAEAGPYPVGVTTLQLPTGPLVEVWYPAAQPVTGTVSYDVRDYVPEAIRAVLTADIPASFAYPAGRDVPAASGPFPVVLFSHGFAGIRVQSSYLTSHLASWGMVVAAPDHPSRALSDVLSGTASGDQIGAVDDLLQSLALLATENDAPDGRLNGVVDLERVGIVGHSAGGGTTIITALDPRVDGYVSLAAGGPPDGSPYPATPSLFMAGALDAIVPPAERTRPAFDGAPAPTTYVELADTGHLGFADFCTFGNGAGIVGVAEASGLGGFLDSQPQFRRLGTDGCLPPNAPVEAAFPAVRHVTTAFLRELFGDDPETVGLGPELADAYDVAISVQTR